MPSVDLAAFADGLALDADGVWRSGAELKVDYPAGGHDFLADVEDASFWVSHRLKSIGLLVNQWPPSGPLFDIGGGNGVVSASLHEAGVEVVLVEPGADGVRRARARGLPTVVQAGLRTAGFLSGALPAVGMFDVLEHIEDDVGTLAWLARVIRPSGRLYLTVPALPWLWSVEDEHLGHHRRYTQAKLVRLVTEAGFEVDLASYLFAPLVGPVLLLRSLPSALGLRRSSHRLQRVEHRGGGIAWALSPLLALERARLRSRRPIPLGTSVVLVARRRP